MQIAHIPTQVFTPIKYIPSSRKSAIRALRVTRIYAVGQLPPPSPSQPHSQSQPGNRDQKHGINDDKNEDNKGNNDEEEQGNHWSLYLRTTQMTSPLLSPKSPISASTPTSNNINNTENCTIKFSKRSAVRLDCVPTYAIPSTVLPGGSKAQLVISELVGPPNTRKGDAKTTHAFPLEIFDDDNSNNNNNGIEIQKNDDGLYAKVCRMDIPDDMDGNIVTVGDVVELLVGNGRHRYEFNERGTGCRMWVYGVIELLRRQQHEQDSQQQGMGKNKVELKEEKHGGLMIESRNMKRFIADDGQAEAAEAAMLIKYPSGRAFALDRGAYY